MKYNPQIHRRRSIRLKGYDYSQAGAYFITICTKDRQRLFGEIIDGEMVLNEMGTIAYNEWLKTPELRPNVSLDVFVIMPNHMHGIIVINDGETGRGELHSPPDDIANTDELNTGELNRGELNRGELNRGELNRGELNRGELNRGELNRGELNRGELNRGELNRGELNRGELNRGELNRGELNRGELNRGELNRGELNRGELNRGELNRGELNRGELNRGELNRGELNRGELNRGELNRGELNRGELNRGELNRGELNRGELNRGELNRGELNRGELNRGELNRGELNRGECNSPLPLITPFRSPSGNIGAIVRGYKSSVTKQINLLNYDGTVWQRNYHEHIIRNERSYQRISDYIIDNPKNWIDDKFYIK